MTANARYLADRDPWMLGEDIPDCDLFFSQIWLNCFVNRFGERTGRAYKKILARYQGYHLWFYFGEHDSNAVAANIVKRMLARPNYAVAVNTNILRQSRLLRAVASRIPKRGLDRLTDRELWSIYDLQDKTHKTYYTWAWIPVAADMFHNNLTDRLKEYLHSLGLDEVAANEAFVTLTQPTKRSLILTEQLQMLKIAASASRSARVVVAIKNQSVAPLPQSVMAALERHRRAYSFTKHIWVRGEYTLADYVEQLKEILEAHDAPAARARAQLQKLAEVRQQRTKLLRTLHITGGWRTLFDAFGDFMVTKIERRYAQLLAVHHMDVVLQEIAHRRAITEMQVRFLLPAEVRTLLLEKRAPHDIAQRPRGCVYYAENGYDVVLTGKRADALAEKTQQTIATDVKELRGQTGCPGYGKGVAKLIIRAADMKKMNKGDVLVSIATDPDIVPAMKIASAIVTEQGGVTSHAAIVSRELNVPCVIGTKIATKVFHDGDLVEVDASAGIVRKILK